jgi:hypothetical protein
MAHCARLSNKPSVLSGENRILLTEGQSRLGYSPQLQLVGCQGAFNGTLYRRSFPSCHVTLWFSKLASLLDIDNLWKSDSMAFALAIHAANLTAEGSVIGLAYL